MDVHKDSISAGILEPGVDDPTHNKIFHDEPSIRRLLDRFEPAKLRVCYEAGPTGYGLARLATSMGIDCQVVANSTGASKTSTTSLPEPPMALAGPP